jgi:D-tyrosyl-tRNA(Tyr) deacylase
VKIVIQRVKSAKVNVKGEMIAEVRRGLLLLVGVGKDDRVEEAERLAKKVTNLRIFEDEQGKMNLNIKQVNGQILSVPQFTLYADTQKGNRPGFEFSAEPGMAKEYWQRFNNLIQKDEIDVKTGVFGAHMEVELINDGPVTIIMERSSH